MITVTHLVKSFGTTRAVSDLSFSIKPGEIVGLLGPNGAGKTTTMRLLSGFITPDSGTIELEGINVSNEPREAQQKIGYLPENNPLYKDMLVSEMLTYSGSLKGLQGVALNEAINFSVQSVFISDVYHRPVSELSKGYKQRVGMAIALLHKPKILIMDEPSEGLDPNQRSEVRSLIKSLSKHHTIIISTHVMQEVEAVCSRMIIINKGQLVADGTPRDLIRKSGSGSVLEVELEGKFIESKLKNLPGIESVTFEKSKNSHIRAKLTLSKGVQVQPALSTLAAENKWIIWRLAQNERQLEDVFHALTGMGGNT